VDVLVDPSSAGHCNKISPVRLASGALAWWKPVTGTSAWVARAYRHTPNTMIIAEGAAWQIAAMLGDPFDRLVAPCRIAELDLGDGPSWGALSLHQEGEPRLPISTIVARGGEEQLRAAAFFDALIGNQDRNPGNYLWDDTDDRLVLIDHSLSFPGILAWRGAQDLLVWRSRGRHALLTEDEEDGLATVLDLDHQEEAASYLDRFRMRALVLRSEWMLLRRRVRVPLHVWLRGYLP
jgi:hypothetical protein